MVQISVYHAVRGDNAGLTGRHSSSHHWAHPVRCCSSNFSLSISCTFLVSARTVPQRSRHRRGASCKCALSYVPLQPHRRPAFKNVPIFERFHFADLQVYSAEPTENRNIFSGRWSKRREWGPGRVVLRAANPNRTIAGGNRSKIPAFARNASPPDDFFGYFLVRITRK